MKGENDETKAIVAKDFGIFIYNGPYHWVFFHDRGGNG